MSGAEGERGSGLDERRRRAIWRASHRGTKEMDIMLGTFARASLAAMDSATLARFERLLALSDPDLIAWVLAPELVEGSELGELIGALRRFHKLEPDTP